MKNSGGNGNGKQSSRTTAGATKVVTAPIHPTRHHPLLAHPCRGSLEQTVHCAVSIFACGCARLGLVNHHLSLHMSSSAHVWCAL